MEAHDAEGRVHARRIEWFFSALDRLASSLDALERELDRHGPKLGDGKPELDEALARIRGSLTTFNVLFQHKEDYFRSK